MEIINTFLDVMIKYADTIITAVIGIIVSTLIYIKGRKYRNPIYIIRSINLVRENVNKLDTVEILYAKENVQNLSVSKIALWNDGKETISSTDVASKSPIRLTINEDYKFLNAEILYQKNSANDFSVKVSDDNRFIDISFEYFDYEEGIVLQAFHTGSSSEDISIEGQIKTVKKIHRKNLSFFPFPKSLLLRSKSDKKKNILTIQNMRKFMGWYLIIGGIIIILSYLYSVIFKNPVEIIEKERQIGFSVTAAIYSTVMSSLYLILGLSFVKRRIPKGYNIFNEEF